MEELLNEDNFRSLAELENIPNLNISGIYAIRLKSGAKLPEPFGTELIARNTTLIYIGKAGRNLRARLNAECRGIGHGTFFRSIGAILGCMPPQGSLIGKRNQYNYKFSQIDRTKIVDWINQYLEFSFVETREGININDAERELIIEHTPILNITHNHQRLLCLIELREQCRNYALQPVY